jgi:hypothetical protein
MSYTINKASFELEMFLKGQPTIKKEIKPLILELLEVFVNQGHSGMSAGLVLNLFKNSNKEELVTGGVHDKEEYFYGGMTGKAVEELWGKFQSQDYGSFIDRTIARDIFITLAKQQPLCPITGEEEEWGTCAGVTQNARCSALFKEKDTDKAYYIDAIVWQGEDSWDTFTGRVCLPNGEVINSRQYVKFPFEPKTFYIDVYKEILSNDWDREPFIEWDYFTEDKTKVTEKYRYIVKDLNQLDGVFEYYDRVIIK